MFNNPSLPICIVKADTWFLDPPVTYDDTRHQILVREDYNYLDDDHGWVRHYLVYHMHYLFGVAIYPILFFNTENPTNSNIGMHPNRTLDKFAYSFQFMYLEKHKKITDFNQAIKILNKEQHEEILIRFWNSSASNIVEFTLLCASRFLGSNSNSVK